MHTEPTNQWPAEVLRMGFNETVRWEIERRSALNVEMRGVKLSIRPDAVWRDVVKNFNAACAPAGTA